MGKGVALPATRSRTFARKTEGSTARRNFKFRKGNFCYKFRSSLEALQLDSTLIFAVADKNLGLTAVPRDLYVQECHHWLAKTHIPTQESLSDLLKSTKQRLARGKVYPFLCQGLCLVHQISRDGFHAGRSEAIFS